MRNFFRDRNNKVNRRRTFLQRKRFSLESLEDRLLLTAVPNNWGLLAETAETIGPAGQSSIGFDVSVSDGGCAVIGLLVSAAGEGDVDPGRIQIRNDLGDDITSVCTIKSRPDYTPDSALFLLEIPDGTYELTLSSENGAAGDLLCSVFMPGDVNQDGIVSLSEYRLGTVHSTAWEICRSGYASLGVIEFYLTEYGIDLTDPHSVYNPRYDVNMDGMVNCRDVAILENACDVCVNVTFFDLMEVIPNDRGLTAFEGEIGRSGAESALGADSFTAVMQGNMFRSEGYSIDLFEQVGAERSGGVSWGIDCSGLISFGEDGRFTFDASSPFFNPLSEGETLTLAFEYYLDDLTFGGIDAVYDGIYGGTVTVTVIGVNDAPYGAADYRTVYNMTSGELTPAVNVADGVTDPEGEGLTSSIVSAFLAPNRYGIPTGTDEATCFTVSDQGVFGVNPDALGDLLAAVPFGEQVSFTVNYVVADPHGASDGGTVTVTVIGKNDSPSGAGSIGAVYSLADGAVIPPVNLLDGVIDPDNDRLTLSIDGASLSENDYGIPVDADYASYFTVDSKGALSVRHSALSRLLAAVPAGRTVLFTIGYSVSDPYGESTDGTVNLTVVGKNDPPANPSDIRLAGALDGNGELVFTVNLLENLSDPDGDPLTVTNLTIGGETYGAGDIDNLEIDGYFYSYDSQTGLMTVTAANETAVSLRLAYNASDGTLPLSWFTYQFTDGTETAGGIVNLDFIAADDPAQIVSVPSDLTVVRNPNAAPGETVSLGEAAFFADRDGYTVSILVTDQNLRIVNTGELADLVTASVTQSVPDGSILFSMSDPLINLLETGATYTIQFGLVNEEIEDYDSFNFTVKDLQVSPVEVSLTVAEGKVGESSAVPQDTFAADFGGVRYQSASYAVGSFVQTSASSSARGPVTADFTPFFRWNAESGTFLFDASGEAFDFLAEGELLSVAADYYLDDLVFDGYSESYSGVKGGAVTVTVTGVNDAPRGAGNYGAVLILETGELSPTVNLFAGVTDPDGGSLTALIESAVLAANSYGIPDSADYSSCFTVDENGVFGIDRDALAELLAAVPAGGSVVFQIGYSVSDPFGAADHAAVALTVIGRNEAPSGAENGEASYDLLTGALDSAVNVLTAVTDPDGDSLTASVVSAHAEANPYISSETDLAAYFGFDAAGNFAISGAAFAELLAALPISGEVTVNVAYAVSDPYGASNGAVVRVSFLGAYDAPAFTGKITDVAGEYGGSVSIDLANYFTGSVSGYTIDLAGGSSILDSWSIEGSVLTLSFIQSGDYDSRLNLSDLVAVVTAHDAVGAEAVSNTFAVSLQGAQTLTLSLACVTEEFGGADVKTLETGAKNFGTFYYIDAGDVPQTDYAAIAAADTYYLELWVSDTSALLTGSNKFFSSIQAQLNYLTDGLGIVTLDIEDIYAGRPALQNYNYYDQAQALLKDIQVTWLFDETKDWSLLEPITNGRNAFLLARFEVTANTASSITLSGVTDPVSPSVEGYYCVRTGEAGAVDDSQIQTVDVIAAGTSPIRGAAAAEYVVDGGVYVRTVTEATETDSSGLASEIGVNADFIHEWQTHYAEIWVKASQRDALLSVSADLAFDPAYFDLANIEFGSAFAGGTFSYDAGGLIKNISASAAGGALTGDGYFLLARVKFTPADGAGVVWNESLAPVRLAWTLASASVATVAGVSDAYLGNAAAVDLWVNPYDVNDDGEVNLIDFVAFANQYGGNSTENYAGVCFDFNRDGAVDLRDFTAFSNVYGVTRADVVSGQTELVFPESFTRRYLGSTLDADNAALVGSICDAAVSAWNSALGVQGNLDLLIVVKDLPDGQLAAAQAVEIDPNTGLPARGTIYLDDDAAGARWSARLAPPAAGSTRYDLYSVILHELGHLYGYNAGSDAFASVADEFAWIGADGHSTDRADLMYPFLEPGARKSVTVHDAAVVAAVQRSARQSAEMGLIDEAFAEFDAHAALWTLDFAVDAVEQAGGAKNPDLSVWDDGLGGDLC